MGMMKQLIVILAFTLSVINTLSAQSTSDSLERKTNIFIQIGAPIHYLKDKSFSPLNYKAGGLALKAGLTHSINLYQFGLDLNFVSGNLKNKQISSFTTPFVDGAVKISFLKRMQNSAGKKIKTLAGLQYNTLVHFKQWEEMESWGYLMYHGLNAKSMGKWRISDSKLVQLDIAIPLVGILVRPPYNGYDYFIEQHQDNFIKLAFTGKFATWNHYQGLDFKISYLTKMEGRLHFMFAYDFSYQGTDVTQKFRYFQNRFTIGFNRI